MGIIRQSTTSGSICGLMSSAVAVVIISGETLMQDHHLMSTDPCHHTHLRVEYPTYLIFPMEIHKRYKCCFDLVNNIQVLVIVGPFLRFGLSFPPGTACL